MTWILIAIFFIHFLADFVFQTDRMAKNKSKSWNALSQHIGEYLFVLIVGMSFFVFRVPIITLLWFCVFNAVLHFGIDAVTSRITSHYWKLQRSHAFFVVVGFDQFLHLALLVWSAEFFGVYR